MALYEDTWKSSTFRQSVVSKLEELIQRAGVQVARNSSEIENHVFLKAKTREEYMNMVAKLVVYVRELSKVQAQQGQPQQGPNNQGGLIPDPINDLF